MEMHRGAESLRNEMQVAPSRARKLGMLVGVVVASAATLTLIGLSLIFSYDPQLVVHGYKPTG